MCWLQTFLGTWHDSWKGRWITVCLVRCPLFCRLKECWQFSIKLFLSFFCFFFSLDSVWSNLSNNANKSKPFPKGRYYEQPLIKERIMISYVFLKMKMQWTFSQNRSTCCHYKNNEAGKTIHRAASKNQQIKQRR